MALSEIVTIRVTPQEKRKLDLIAKRTQRPMSHILRILIAQAELPKEPDVRLKQGDHEYRQVLPA